MSNDMRKYVAVGIGTEDAVDMAIVWDDRAGVVDVAVPLSQGVVGALSTFGAEAAVVGAVKEGYWQLQTIQVWHVMITAVGSN